MVHLAITLLSCLHIFMWNGKDTQVDSVYINIHPGENTHISLKSERHTKLNSDLYLQKQMDYLGWIKIRRCFGKSYYWAAPMGVKKIEYYTSKPEVHTQK